MHEKYFNNLHPNLTSIIEELYNGLSSIMLLFNATYSAVSEFSESISDIPDLVYMNIGSYDPIPHQLKALLPVALFQ